MSTHREGSGLLSQRVPSDFHTAERFLGMQGAEQRTR